MRLRQATAADAAAIGEIWNPIIRDTVITFWPTERSEADIIAYIADRAALGHPFLLAEDEGTRGLLGFASYGQFRGGAGYGKSMEHSVAAAPAMRGHGIGPILMQAIENHARDRDMRLMIGAITASNTRSIRFHQRLGYAEWGRIPAAGQKFGRFHDLVLMGKDLTA